MIGLNVLKSKFDVIEVCLAGFSPIVVRQASLQKLPYFPHYRTQHIIRHTINEWSILEMMSYYDNEVL